MATDEQPATRVLHFRPCARRQPSEFQRMRRPRLEYQAAGRRLRSLYGARSGAVTMRTVGAHSVEFTGATGAVLEAVQALEVRWMRSKDGTGVLVQHEAAEDVMAFIEGILGKRIDVTF